MFRPVEQTDHREVVSLLRQLSQFSPEENLLNEIWISFAAQNNVFSFVGEYAQEIVAYGSLVIETKIRGGKVGHIEDVVIKDSFRKNGFGKLLVEHLCKTAIACRCYRISLQCPDKSVAFYKKCGFNFSEIGMSRVP
jgi:glucosamine-phosphate N-acetyltransferase